MNDDLGRGQIGWGPEQWQEIDALAAETIAAQAVMRKVVDNQDAPGARSVRIAGKNVDVRLIKTPSFVFDMQEEELDDLRRAIQNNAQILAKAEDTFVLAVMASKSKQLKVAPKFDAFSRARAELGKEGVQQGFGVVVSPMALSELETEVKGLRSGLELVEQNLSTNVIQSSALPIGNAEAIVVQAAPAAYRLVHAGGPQVRVLSLVEGRKLKLQLEEWIGAGQLESDRSVFIGA